MIKVYPQSILIIFVQTGLEGLNCVDSSENPSKSELP